MSSNARIKMKLNSHDVLLGRGDWSVRYEGNVRFRDLIREKRNLFGTASGRTARDKIASDVVRVISERGGRFLRRGIEPDESKREDTSPMESSWLVIDKKTAMKKVKQAFHDKDSWKQVVQPSAPSSAAVFLNHVPQSDRVDQFREDFNQPICAFQLQQHAASTLAENQIGIELESTMRAAAYRRLETEAATTPMWTVELEQLRRSIAMRRNLPRLPHFSQAVQQMDSYGEAGATIEAVTAASVRRSYRAEAFSHNHRQLLHFVQQQLLEVEAEAIRVAARTADQERLRLFDALTRNSEHPLVQQALLSIRQQQQVLQHDEFALRSAMLTPPHVSSNSSVHEHGPFLSEEAQSLALPPLDAIQQMSQLQQRVGATELYRELAALPSFPPRNISASERRNLWL
jgi:hypothetical protein